MANLLFPKPRQGVTPAKLESKLVYDWLIEPFEADFKATGVDTLVFVLDGAFRNVPMGVLYDGEQYLIEKYALGVNLGL